MKRWTGVITQGEYGSSIIEKKKKKWILGRKKESYEHPSDLFECVCVIISNAQWLFTYRPWSCASQTDTDLNMAFIEYLYHLWSSSTLISCRNILIYQDRLYAFQIEMIYQYINPKHIIAELRWVWNLDTN